MERGYAADYYRKVMEAKYSKVIEENGLDLATMGTFGAFDDGTAARDARVAVYRVQNHGISQFDDLRTMLIARSWRQIRVVSPTNSSSFFPNEADRVIDTQPV